ncbi:hypothetical protein GUITHDRAFT_143380 [Guillardia theta CCMP2712]|uniref:Uncharacterized protein n=1 Tax=Guillardia theta (strain CCMP2712) TaxID=905079 RepID=L1IUL9_GUITC|nr:hypothetical protein GUITHDRAFT_143380 [Guillardia theta CCMP2712]EKX39599.1 hypothetical protein GUITHDRAFT_143380 [Guillardia theta CCMP2712]|eukprot:XP_005826579.1 hypothetical protein GUITHDRAFT_143380 [Guillardia theta CCMP2712]
MSTYLDIRGLKFPGPQHWISPRRAHEMKEELARCKAQGKDLWSKEWKNVPTTFNVRSNTSRSYQTFEVRGVKMSRLSLNKLRPSTTASSARYRSDSMYSSCEYDGVNRRYKTSMATYITYTDDSRRPVSVLHYLISSPFSQFAGPSNANLCDERESFSLRKTSSNQFSKIT